MNQTDNSLLPVDDDFGLIQPGRNHFRLVGWFCVASAVVHVFSLLLSLQVVRIGDLLAFSPVKLMRFISDHQLLWRSCCLFNGISSVSSVLIFLMFNMIVDRKVRILTRVGMLLTIIACASELNAHSSFLVLLSDLAVQLKLNSSYLKNDLLQLSWVIINQSLAQILLVGNTLWSVAGLLATVAILQTKSLPKWLVWIGMPVWLLSFSATCVAFAGELSLCFSMMLAFQLGFVLWTVCLAIVLDLHARPEPAPPPPPKQLADSN